jgi:hypothetical protein
MTAPQSLIFEDSKLGVSSAEKVSGDSQATAPAIAKSHTFGNSQSFGNPAES